jgi:mRNA-degrading endonuclease RelE of RelBE toxin-antitoxin system
MTETLTVRIPESMRTELMELSKEQQKPVSDLVRESLQKFIAIQRFRKLRKVVIPFAEARGIFTDEDVFREFS